MTQAVEHDRNPPQSVYTLYCQHKLILTKAFLSLPAQHKLPSEAEKDVSKQSLDFVFNSWIHNHPGGLATVGHKCQDLV